MLMRLMLPLEMDRVDPEMSETMPITATLIFERGKWRGQCAEPPVSTVQCDTLEEAILATGREIERDWRKQDAAAQAAQPKSAEAAAETPLPA